MGSLIPALLLRISFFLSPAVVKGSRVIESTKLCCPSAINPSLHKLQRHETLLHVVDGKSYEIRMFSFVLFLIWTHLASYNFFKPTSPTTDSILLFGVGHSVHHWPAHLVASWGLSQDLFAYRVAGARCDVTFVPGCREAFLLEKGQVSQGWRSDPWKPKFGSLFGAFFSTCRHWTPANVTEQG